MDGRLFEAARTGDVSLLHQLLLEKPSILADCQLIFPHENPLNIATKAGQLAFVQQILKHRPDFVRQSNQDGFRPLDIASAFGYVEIVKEITTCYRDVCRLKGREGRTCLHYAAINERVEIIDELLNTSGECVKDVTSLGETALHLALKYYKVEAFTNLVKWLEELGLEELVNSVDKDGNTILHLAVSRKQLESVELLLKSSNISNILELNVRNSRGFTATDLLDNSPVDNPNDIRLKEILQFAGALSTETPHNTMINNPKHSTGVSKDWIKYFQFQMERDSPSDTRNALLVVAALIATVTFQAGMNPPSSFTLGAPAANSTSTTSSAPSPVSTPEKEYNYPGVTSGLLAVFASSGSLVTSNLFYEEGRDSPANARNVILVVVTLIAAVTIPGGVWQDKDDGHAPGYGVATAAMLVTYTSALYAVTPDDSLNLMYVLIAAALPFVIRCLIHLFNKCIIRFKSKSNMHPDD
ncbi:ankyrin repeat-containing protein BDA1-like [Pistacia vera]|uniref:ankyrin repeat-containing protein BDA1-like n=1 Tax=Pistacia vera TaxID=55513 RepID=UPI001262BB18|nr:ankyrin repeat-containing protein BDA1-like [Pistacia vera]